jgi:hypothetical protein
MKEKANRAGCGVVLEQEDAAQERENRESLFFGFNSWYFGALVLSRFQTCFLVFSTKLFEFSVAVSSLIVQVEGCLLEISSCSLSMHLMLSKFDRDHQRLERDSTFWP